MDKLPLPIQARMKIESQFFPNGVNVHEIKLLSKIEELVTQAFTAGSNMTETVSSEQWSNQSAFGYAIMAAERIGTSTEDIQRLVRSMHNRFDLKTLGEAAEHYRKSPY
jgi:hypothetical protein